METLADGILKEQERCRELLEAYTEIGPAGAFAHSMINDALRRTEKAVMQGDTVAMLALYKELKGFK